jgi:hypothetical protein
MVFDKKVISFEKAGAGVTHKRIGTLKDFALHP